MKRIARALGMFGIAAAGVVLPLSATADATPESSVGTANVSRAEGTGDVGVMATSHGPYRDLGTCNYWMYGVRAGGRATSNCYFVYHQPVCPGGNCSINNTGWWFDVY